MEEANSFSFESSEDEKDTEPYVSYRADKATPLFDLSSVSIHSDTFKKFDHVKFYCHVKLIDDNGHELSLLDQECSDDVVSFCPPDDFLKIILGKSKLNRPHVLPKHFFLKVYLEDRNRKTVIMDESLFLDFSSKVVFDEEQCLALDIQGVGIVNVCYTIFRYAVFAFVECRVVKIKEEDDLHAFVSGTISATSKFWNRSISRVLFDNRHSDTTMLASTELCCKSCFPVPAYSPFQIHAKLEINDEIIESSDENGLEFGPSDNTTLDKKEIVGQKWRILVNVTMEHINFVVPENVMWDYDFKPEDEGDSKLCAENVGISDSENSSMFGEEMDEFLERNETSIVECGKISAESGSENIPENEEIRHWCQEKRLRPHYVEHPVSDMSIDRIDPIRLPLSRFSPLVELFSISACPYVDENNKLDGPLLLYGKIMSFDVMGEYDIFDRQKDNSAFLHPHETISLVDTRRCYMGAFFAVTLDLKDGQGRMISKGDMSWNVCSAERWYDRRLCSVVRGNDGFAAIHYMMFSDAVQAKVNVSFKSKDGRACQVRGKIWAKYDGHKYSTVYERKSYQSVLFRKGKTEFVELCDGVDVPLSKSVVSVAFDDVFVVKFDLHIVFPDKKELDKKELLKGKTIFKPQESREPRIHSAPQIIEGPSCGVTVFVEWG